ncbi:hypothetical protein RB601_003859 [Gaeumannomyces tritici]
MHLLFVRHGESTDNAAGVIAGSTDSPLSSHGVNQARRLGEHLASRRPELGPVVHVFSSDLQRALDTAQEVVAAQGPAAPPVPVLSSSLEPATPSPNGSSYRRRPDLVPLALLREKDFGSREGAPYGKRAASHRSASAGHHHSPTSAASHRSPGAAVHRSPGSAAARPLGYMESETQEQMMARMECFAQAYLLPLMSRLTDGEGARRRQTVVVVAHGIILNVLTRVLLSEVSASEYVRLFGTPAGEAGILSARMPPRAGEFAIHWGNTGYLEAVVVRVPPLPASPVSLPRPDRPPSSIAYGDRTRTSRRRRPVLNVRVISVNNTHHLDGLRKTRGGIGSAKFDSRQRTMDAFLLPSTPKRQTGSPV